MEEKQLNLFEENWTLNEIVYSEFPQNETTELEYKSAAGGFPIGALETYSAFANTDGGMIVLGVSQKKGFTNFDGLDDNNIHRIKVTLWDLINNKKKVSKNILRNEDVKEVIYNEKKLVVIHVPAASRSEKPIFLNNNPLEETYKRNYEGDYKCKEDEVKRMFADADITNHHDNRILENFNLSDIDSDSLIKYKQMFAIARPAHPWLSLNDREFLEMIGGYRRDKKTGKEGFTVASMLMFGKTNSIIDPECVPTFFPDYQELLNDESKDIRWTDRIYPDGTWEANLMQFYLKVWIKLSASLPKKFQLNNGQRQDHTSAHTALREAFVNSLIHADYTLSGHITIKQNKDKFVFTNQGTLLVTLHQYYKGGLSECRNPVIQKMLLNIGVAEKIGSGVNKIVSGWKESHWRTPKLIVEKMPDRITLELYTVNMLPKETLDQLRVLFGGIEEFSRDEITTLALCLVEGEVTNSRLQITLNKHSYDITKMLQDLCKREYMSQDGKGRGATYHLNKDYTTKVFQLDVVDDEDFSDSDSNSNVKVDSKNVKVDTKSGNDDSSDRKKLSKEEIDESIIAFCKDEYRTIDEISKFINRNKTYVRNTILPRLTKKGKLIRKFESITHKNQSYKSK